MLHDMVENQIQGFEKTRDSLDDEEAEKAEQLTLKIEAFKAEMLNFEKEVQSQLEKEFQFSVEELYSMYGQYENRFISIEFHKFSESAKKYGRNIRGCIYYPKYEREELEAVTNSEEIPRTNGMVKLEVSEDIELSDELKQELKDNGFQSGDVYQILSLNLPSIKSYGFEGQKEIPHTIDIEFDPTGLDPYLLSRNLYIERLKRGGTLTDFEWNELAGYTCYYEPKAIDSISEKIFDENGSVYPDVRISELTVKYHHIDIEAEDIVEFNELLKQRRLKREEILKREISRSTTKKLEDFETEFPEIYDELIKSTVAFRPESIEYYNSFTPIYLDYERFVHIYLRHCSELGIEGKFEGKTKFQYSPKDIRRVLKIVVEKLLPEINKALSEGKDYRANGAKVLYYNGNHYNIHVSKEGRILAFHPIENPTD